VIAAWMGYAILIAALSSLAALAIEHALRLNGRPGRAVWAAAMGVTVLAPALVTWLGNAARSPITEEATATVARSGLTLFSLSELVVRPTPFLQRMDLPLILMWATASIVTALVLAGAVRRLASLRRRWSPGRVDDTEVLVSDDFGPALVGLTRPEIVIPRWTLDLPTEERALVIAHEEEHRVTHDTRLLASGVIAALLMPWNLPLLWQVRRLRRAVELDCDARVLKRGVSPLDYGTLLLQMGTRMGSRIPFAAALTESPTLLEWRIQMITQREPQGRVKKTILTLASAAIVIVMACETPAPTQLVDAPQADLLATSAEVLPDNAPLIIVDGVITDRLITDLDALEIASIKVVKGSTALDLYGERGANGIVLISTKAAPIPPKFTVQEITR